MVTRSKLVLQIWNLHFCRGAEFPLHFFNEFWVFLYSLVCSQSGFDVVDVVVVFFEFLKLLYIIRQRKILCCRQLYIFEKYVTRQYKNNEWKLYFFYSQVKCKLFFVSLLIEFYHLVIKILNGSWLRRVYKTWSVMGRFKHLSKKFYWAWFICLQVLGDYISVNCFHTVNISSSARFAVHVGCSRKMGQFHAGYCNG